MIPRSAYINLIFVGSQSCQAKEQSTSFNSCCQTVQKWTRSLSNLHRLYNFHENILLMNSCNTDIFFGNYYHLQSVRFEFQWTDAQETLIDNSAKPIHHRFRKS